NAETMINAVSKRLQAGEIAYLDWVIIVNNAISVRSDYYQLVQQHNEAAFQIEKLTATNNK
ncbi:MAG TPA: TolC family protein, partial [Flavisolibacter sp.]|nr:TolC family protein [Flavisolibacter sp.]